MIDWRNKCAKTSTCLRASPECARLKTGLTKGLSKNYFTFEGKGGANKKENLY